jgi:hypothetical protein
MITDRISMEPRRRLWRSRWAAIGAAVAVTLGGGGMVAVNAASSPASSVVTIDPVRILDTRDPVNIGLPGPFVSAVSQKLQVTGAAVPVGATGVLLNVTVVNPSAAGFLSVRPGDASGAPSTSSLNFEAGDLIPNAVQVGLPTAGANAGQIDITYDAYGLAGPTTEVLIDVVGYMVEGAAGSDPALLARVDALESQVAALDAREPFAVTGYDATEGVTLAPEVVVSIAVTAPSNGHVTVNSTTQVDEDFATDAVGCAISVNGSVDFGFGQLWESPGNPGQYAQMAGTRTFEIVGDATVTYTLVCAHNGESGDATLRNSVLTAIFTPAP